MKRKILAIDDDPLILKTLKNLLMGQGYEIEIAKSSQEAEAIIRRDDTHLIICDIRMPGKDGISLIKDIKRICQEELKREMPFIFITGYASEEAPIDAVKLGAKDYILKPFDIDELLKSIALHLPQN